jgi:hypothetical protein
MLVAITAHGAEKKNQKKKGSASKKAAQKIFGEYDRRIKAARKHAQSVSGRLAQIKSEAASVGSEANKSKKEFEEATANLAILEREAIENAPTDSAFAKARAKHDAARARLRAESDRLLNLPSTRAAISAASDARAVAELKAQLLDSSLGMAGLRELVRESRLVYEPELRKLLQADASWSRGQASIAISRSAYQFNKKRLTKIVAQRAEAVAALHNAKEIVVALEVGKVQAQIAYKRAEEAKRRAEQAKKKGQQRNNRGRNNRRR